MPELVSIITPSFNRADIVSATADSIFSQTYGIWEWIIVDDGSTDGSEALFNSYVRKDSRVRFFHRDRMPKGACVCRNIGVDYSRGKYLIFLDTDDLLEPFCLEQRVRTMEDHPHLDFGIYPSLMFEKEAFDLNLWWNIDKEVPELIRQLHQDAICQGTGVLWKRTSFDRIGRWDESLYLWQDIDLFLKAFILGYAYKKFFDLPPDLHNRVTQTSLSRGNFFELRKLESRVQVIKRAVELLQENGQELTLREVRYMLSEVVSGFIRSGHNDRAKQLIDWGASEGVFSDEETSVLETFRKYWRFRLYRIPFVKQRIESRMSMFYMGNTLGKIPYKIQN